MPEVVSQEKYTDSNVFVGEIVLGEVVGEVGEQAILTLDKQ